MKVVIDASTVVGAALKFSSIPRQALVEVVGRHELILSAPIFVEISEVLQRPKFAKSIPEEVRLEILGILSGAATWVEPSNHIDACRDPKDDSYLEAAVAASADVIVSSDDDLRSMTGWRGILIVSPRLFLEIACGKTRY